MEKFQIWAGRRVDRCRSPELDGYLIDYFDRRFMEGAGFDEGQKLLRRSATSSRGSPGSGEASYRELIGRSRAGAALRPCGREHRYPVPWVALMAMTGVAIHFNRRSLAAAMLLGFTAYLRPSELVELTPASLVPPQTRVDSRLKYWAVIVRPLELGIPAKTGDFDESVVLDSPHLEWFGEVLHVLRRSWSTASSSARSRSSPA